MKRDELEGRRSEVAALSRICAARERSPSLGGRGVATPALYAPTTPQTFPLEIWRQAASSRSRRDSNMSTHPIIFYKRKRD